MSIQLVKDGKVSQIVSDMGLIHDDYHSFNELYDHRIVLFIALMKTYPTISWWSEFHHDETRMEGWIIAGMHLPTGDITYHIPEKWADEYMSDIEHLTTAPEWDGHTSKDVLDRLKNFTVDGCEDDE